MDSIDLVCTSIIIVYYLIMGLWLLSERGKNFFAKKGKILGIKDATFLNFMGVTLIAISTMGAMTMLYYSTH